MGSLDLAKYGDAKYKEHPISPYRYVSPFPSFVVDPPYCFDGTGSNILGFGSSGLILLVHRHIAFKGASTIVLDPNFDDWYIAQGADQAKGLKLAKEKRYIVEAHQESGRFWIANETERLSFIAQQLTNRPSIHIIQPHLAVPEGIFLPRLHHNMNDRLCVQEKRAFTLFPQYKLAHGREIRPALKLRWALQLSRACAWMEKAGLYHGDFRPSNFLLDRFENVVLADFGGCAPLGEEQRTAHDVFYPYDWMVGSTQSEVYAYGWCLYNIFHGSVPRQFEISPPEKVVFPSVEHLGEIGGLIDDCWHDRFPKVADMERAMLVKYRTLQPWYHQMFDQVCEGAAWVTLAFTRRYLLWRMKRLHRTLKSAPPAPIADEELDRIRANWVTRVCPIC